jgi:hypothetical protein
MTTKLFSVPVRNEHTGEERCIPVTAGHYADAQALACSEMLHKHGWQKTRAFQPRDLTPNQEKQP